MSMFETVGKVVSSSRKPGTQAKLDRLRKTLRHEEPDRVPVSDFFWGGSSVGGARNWGCPPMPIRTITTTSTGFAPCPTWIPGSGRVRF